MSQGYFSYVRVSTARQGQTGTSLIEQREAIQRYASRWGLCVVKEFEEQETAARKGRPVFLQMLRELKRGKANGVIIHKIDRSARNLRDWAELGEFIDCGIEVHFANENLDLESRGGRLSADIQAVVAADYIRNLREEVKKGFYGRLKQGFYPMPAPLGYLDQGAAKPKIPDPVRAPLVRKMFELYSTERYSFDALVEAMYESGLRTKNGRKVTKNSISVMLHNPFYTGLIRIKRKEELFVGQHAPIVPKRLFDHVQLVLTGRAPKTLLQHDWVFRRLIQCSGCDKRLIAETQKGFVYYRCHTRTCPQKTIREDTVETAMKEILNKIRFSEQENNYLREEITKHCADENMLQENLSRSLTLQLDQLKDRVSKLTDAYVDGMIDKETYVEKKNHLLMDKQALRDRLVRIRHGIPSAQEQLQKILELANNAHLSYEMGNEDEKRDLVKSLTSNFLVTDKTVLIKLKTPFESLANREVVLNGGPQRDTARTLSRLVRQLLKSFVKDEIELSEKKFDEPVKITERRLRLAFRRANGVDEDRLAA